MVKLLSFSLLKNLALIVSLILLCYLEAFPAALTACEVKAYHLNATTPLLAPARRLVFQQFWESDYAPVCEPAKQDDDDNNNINNNNSFTVSDVLEWTGNFGSFANTVLEDSFLPKLRPFASNKIRAVTQSIAASWEPTTIEQRIHNVWITTVQPRVPDSVISAWKEAFAPADDDFQQPPDNSAAPPPTPTHDDDFYIDFTIEKAFFAFILDGTFSLHGKAISFAPQPVDYQAIFSSFYQQAGRTYDCMNDSYSSVVLRLRNLSPATVDLLLCFCMGLLFSMAFFIWFAHRAESRQRRRRAENQRQEERQRQEEHQRQAEYQPQHQDMSEPDLKRSLVKIQKATAEVSDERRLRQLAVCVLVVLKDESRFEDLVQCLENSTLNCPRILYVCLRHAFNPDRLPEDANAGLRNEFEKVYNLVEDVGKKVKLIDSSDDSKAIAQWSDFTKFVEEAKKMDEKQPFTLEILGEIIHMSLPSEEKHFDSYRTHYRSRRKTLRTTYIHLAKILHSDRFPSNFSLQHREECTEVLKMVNSAHNAAKADGRL